MPMLTVSFPLHSMPTFFAHIQRIFVISGGKQVGRIYALPIVAAVANLKPCWYFAICQLIRKSVNKYSPPSNHYLSIPFAVKAALPFPTGTD